MPTPTYDLIEEKVLGSAQATVTFSSIPGTYKDLVLEFVGTMTATGNSSFVRVNGDTATNYSFTMLSGNGTAASSVRGSNSNQGLYFASNNGFDSTVYTARMELLSYANTNVNKTVLVRWGQASTDMGAAVDLWRSTAAITSLEARTNGAANFASGCVFRLWGVSG